MIRTARFGDRDGMGLCTDCSMCVCAVCRIDVLDVWFMQCGKARSPASCHLTFTLTIGRHVSRSRVCTGEASGEVSQGRSCTER